jgi:hypothetical protein
MGEIYAFLLLVIIAIVVGAVVAGVGLYFFGRAAPERREVTAIAERVRSVGKLIGLEVHAKEIATAKKGWSWMPPLVLSQARLAMIFQFEKQYYVDLAAIRPHHITSHGPGNFRIKMPPIQGSLRLMEVKPYDIQQGKALGLVDVIPMTAERQGALMEEAQTQAAELFDKSDERYHAQAIDSIERNIRSLLGLTGAVVEFVWPNLQPQIGPIETDEPALQAANALPEGKPNRAKAVASV